MKISHLLAAIGIIVCTTVAWFVLGAALSYRTMQSSTNMNREVSGVWGPQLDQQHPEAWFETPNAPGGKASVLPSSSRINVNLDYSPKRRGLLWHRTYDLVFRSEYVFTNPTKIPQTLYINFPLPENTGGLKDFEFALGDQKPSAREIPGESGVVTRAILLPASGSVELHAGYKTRGTDTWRYLFPDNRRISGFHLAMVTNFEEINFPVGTGSPSERTLDDGSYTLAWDYPDMLAATAIGMDMPKRLNAGPIASRISFFAPVSLLLFITLILLIGGIKGIPLHPMHVFFIAAGFFAFHLLFAYLVDLLPLMTSFGIAAATSVLLVCGYLWMVGGNVLFKIALPAQIVYLVLFSASFFIDGLTGITLSVLGVLTLALLMLLTARIDWKVFFTKKPVIADRVFEESKV
ncbi:MAG: DUF4424 domain-containing protein [Akkermansiaceae bacterium]|nr:DUF4424 domain-containing protein [Akkermansiaceae bacterium]MCF7732584.1 DUF4424 domain-containing protein [Akkermansiaceae bacterium]